MAGRDDDDPATVTAAASSGLGSLASMLGALASTGGEPRPLPLVKGTLVDGIYRIEGAIGKGGMGVVYLARDVRLDRDVAIKLGTAVTAAALARVEREAVALARLSHPNVVVIYQVGEVDGRLYLAMEHVAGGNARQWLAARPRTWREIVALYAAAGDGLEAAHAAGLVHRDFKPDNVLVGDDGRPRVADFGLVRSDGAAGVDTPPPPADGEPLPRVTQTGAVMGTPAYMAPEQIEAADVDARADQFGFCVSVWEALFGARPFPGRTPLEIAGAIARDAPAPPHDRRARAVPRHVVAALRRGLRRDRDARWPSMSALLVALRDDPDARRRGAPAIARAGLAAIVAAGLVAGAIALGKVGGAAAESHACELPASLAPRWDLARRAQVRAALARGAERDADALAGALDRYPADWAAGYRAACLATRVLRTQSDELLDKRMACLDAHRAGFDAIVEVAVDRATPARRLSELIGSLAPVAECADRAALDRQPAPPGDPAARAEIALVRRINAEIRSLAQAGRFGEAAAMARAVAPRARATHYAPLIAQIVHRLALDEHGVAAMKLYDECIEAALAGGLDVTAANAMSEQAALAAELGDLAGAERAIGMARGLLARTGDRGDEEAQLELNAAEVYTKLGVRDRARAARDRAVALARTADRDNPVALAGFLVVVGKARADDGDVEGGRPLLEEGRDLALRARRADHPLVLGADNELAQIAMRAHDLGRAEALARRTLDASLGGDDPDAQAEYAQTLAEIDLAAGRPSDAVEVMRAQLDRAHARGDRSSDWRVMHELAIAYNDAGDHRQAIAAQQREIDLLRDQLAPDHPSLLLARTNLGIFYRDAGLLAQAEAVLREGLRLAQARPDDDPYRLDLEAELGETLRVRGHAGDAVPLLSQRAAALAHGDPAASASARFLLAESLYDAGARARARALAAQADADLAGLGADAADLRAEVAAWRRRHR